MAINSTQVDIQIIKNLYSENSVPRAAFDYFATRKRNRSETTVNQLLADLVARGHQVSYIEVRDFLRELARLNCGVYIIGRKRHPSRLQWRVGRVNLGQAAAGQPSQVEQLTGEEAAGANDEVEEGPSSVLHPDDLKVTYPLRRERQIELILPKDITPTEAQRLSDFIKTLQFE